MNDPRTCGNRQPWTVSVAIYPGEEPCSELEALDSALRKGRGWRVGDLEVQKMKDKIEWPEPKEPEQVEWLELTNWMSREQSDSEIKYKQWLDWLTKIVCDCFQVTPEDMARYEEGKASFRLNGQPVKYSGDLPPPRTYKDGEPCDHPGCLSHVSHPCEGCGRTAGRYTQRRYQDMKLLGSTRTERLLQGRLKGCGD